MPFTNEEDVESAKTSSEATPNTQSKSSSGGFWDNLGKDILDNAYPNLTGSGQYKWYKQNTSFSGTDIKVMVQTKSTNFEQGVSSFVTLAELQTLSYSIFRKKMPVSAFGESNVKGFVRGSRVISGSMIFSVFNKHVLSNLTQGDGGNNYLARDIIPTHESFDAEGGYGELLVDQLPPFDIVIVYANEYGSVSRMAIYGCEIISEGQVHSIQDLMTENTVTYVAKYIEPMKSLFSVGAGQSGQEFQQLLQELEEAVANSSIDVWGGSRKMDLEMLTSKTAQISAKYHSIFKNNELGRLDTVKNLLNNEEAQQLLLQSRNPFR